ncbi:MAG: hypothetical protein A2629_01900 [Candidatus Levybacteria bacterium RIFCSPHIGHO2_01_FULL_41_15]|nr:MAG: hypothetical protein A2629_01900 [Candidatus Levybacteria bacterium RIFCSPHIGHO2_01_FULL_41_15]
MKLDKVFEIVSKIPKGKVMTYGQIAKILDTNPRLVGFALHRNKDIEKVPCHRVVKSDGHLATGYAHGGIEKQRDKLEQEGILFAGNRIDLQKSLFS